MTAYSSPALSIDNPSRLSLYAALGGTFFLRVGGGIMGILTGLFLAAKNTELGSVDHPFHISATLAGVVIASFFITELGGSFVSGGLIDRNGPRRYMIVGPLFGAAAMIATGLLHIQADSSTLQFLIFLGILIAARLLEGAAAAAANPASLAYIATYTSHDASLRSRISGYFELATLVGAIIGVVIGGRLWDSFGQGAFLLNTLVYLASAAVFLSVHSTKKEKPAQSDSAFTLTKLSHSFAKYRKLVGSARLRELIPAWLAFSALLGVLLNHATFQLSSALPRGLSEVPRDHIIRFPGHTLSHAFSGSEVGNVFAIYGIAFGLGILIWSLIIPRIRKSTVMLISGGGVIATSLVIIAINHTGPITDPSVLRMGLVVLMVIVVMVESGFTPAALIYLSDIADTHAENRGMIMGLYSFLFGFGQLAGTIVAGPFADWQGIDGLLLFMIILGVICIFAVLLLRRDEESVHEGLVASNEPVPSH
jgi:MFS family permease